MIKKDFIQIEDSEICDKKAIIHFYRKYNRLMTKSIRPSLNVAPHALMTYVKK